ncbi:MAG: hypothetical protein CMI60_13510 [Parvibaculum sp.]|jgi:uncharacterized protein (DUF427 family)|nr:hypothetical protein [Parvibaculum sp.]|tara:strand:- start:99 stop:512 length:414 start_codon:yes stop_codon:yes gene_type:complete
MADQETESDAGAAGILPPGSRTETSFQKPLAFVAADQRIAVFLDGAPIAESTDVIIVHEKGHKPMLYFPRGDVAMDRASPMAQTTHCPRKGDAAYFEFAGSDGRAVAWSYEDPIPQATVLKDYVAFYPDNLEFNRES